jgi:hypothetical protein
MWAFLLLRHPLRLVRNILIAHFIFDTDFVHKNFQEINQWCKDHKKELSFGDSYEYYNAFRNSEHKKKLNEEAEKEAVLKLLNEMNNNGESKEITKFLDKFTSKDLCVGNGNEIHFYDQLKHYITIHITPNKLFETVCIHKLEDIRRTSCYVRLNENAFLKMTPKEALQKLKAYDEYRKIHDEQTMFEIHTDQKNHGNFQTAIEQDLQKQCKDSGV